MKDGVKILRTEDGEILPAMPDGQIIPNIVKESVSYEANVEEVRAGIARLKFEVFIDIRELEQFFKSHNHGKEEINVP